MNPPFQKKADGLRVSTRLIWFVLSFVTGALSAQAHSCGPARIELRVGEACAWKITADLTEVDSKYSPVLEGQRGVAEVTPLRNFQARHGDFVIVAKAPGTNMLGVAWGYAPTGAAGFCEVQIIVKANAGGGEAFQTTQRAGLISVRHGATSISGSALRSMLDDCIPVAARKLLIFTQCYGGSLASDPALVDAPNIAIASATSPNQTGKYGGYHDDAARALRPESGRTALDLHQAASHGKMTVAPSPFGAQVPKGELMKSSEWPRTAGGLALSDFSLEPVSVAGAVKSRHVVVFMGQPEAKTVSVQTHDGTITIPSAQGASVVIDDVADRNAIQEIFHNQPNTTVHTAGGSPSAGNPAAGQNGWEFPGDAEGLKRAMRAAGDAIRNSPDPAAEQFILFVGDHGSEGASLHAAPVTLSASASLSLAVNLSALPGHAEFAAGMQYDLNNLPNVTIELIPTVGGNPPNPVVPPLNPATLDFEVAINLPNSPSIILGPPLLGLLDWNEDGLVSGQKGERAILQFPLEESLLIHRLGGAPFEMGIRNRSAIPVTLISTLITSGAIAKPAYTVPPPLITSITQNASGRLQLTILGPSGQSFDLMSSEDLVNWKLVRTVFFSQATQQVEFAPAPGAARMFVRLQMKLPRLP